MRSCRHKIQVPTNSNLFKISTSRFDRHLVTMTFPEERKDRNADKSKQENKNKYENKESAEIKMTVTTGPRIF